MHKFFCIQQIKIFITEIVPCTRKVIIMNLLDQTLCYWREATCSDCLQAVLKMAVYWDDGTEDVEF